MMPPPPLLDPLVSLEVGENQRRLVPTSCCDIHTQCILKRKEASKYNEKHFVFELAKRFEKRL